MLNKGIIVSASNSFGKHNPEAVTRMINEGYQLIYDSWPTQKTPMEQVVGLVVSTQPVDSRSLILAPNLKIIAKYGAGYDNIDVTAATARDVYVAAAGDANAEAVAEMALSLLLSISRQIPRADKCIRAGKWERFVGHELFGKTVGVIGLGAIGRTFVQRVASFDVRLLGYDPFWNDDFAREYRMRSSGIDDLFSEADFISLHCPLTPQTEKLVNRDRLRLMKSNAYLINTSRGLVIDEEALYEVLVAKKIAGAALDVFQSEPPGSSRLFELDNVILTSHMGAYTFEAFARMDHRTVDSIISVFKGELNPYLINAKEIMSIDKRDLF